MTTIKVGKEYIDVPMEWNELTAEQLLEIMDTFYIKKYDSVQLLLKLMKSLLSLNYKKFFKMKTEEQEEFLYLTGFLLQEKISFSKQLIPVYEGYYGPDDAIGNIRGKEFVYAEHYHELWWQDKNNAEALDDFVAVIYRPKRKRDDDGKKYDFKKDPDGDKRIKFNENISAWYAENVINEWPTNVKLAIATWYAGCRMKLVDDNEDVFGGKGEPSKYGLISILRAIAEKGTYGTFEAVEEMPVSMMMIELNETVEEGKRLEAQTKKA